ncbi:MAG: Hpt domain-containing protein [Epsilonproteobacteria bacterium]|nr:Hpt domain-containing protein [Campylobacterota bacterium]
MLIYNYNKKFIGADLKTLKILGLQNLAQLQAEASDFADLFVKTPGYIHNFKHIHWIDFVSVADPTEQPKVIISVNRNLFKAEIQVHTAYLADEPTKEAYVVNLVNLHILSTSERAIISPDMPEISNSLPETPTGVAVQPILEDDYAAVPDEDIYLDIALDTEDEIVQKEPTQEEQIQQPQTATVQSYGKLNENLTKILENGYTYNPQVASSELGLPPDLIKGFIQDFIEQAKDFKPKLYSALKAEDIENIKILSHKLKGVATNLHIKDALEVLTTINTTSNLETIKKNLTAFYTIIAKLAGGEDLPDPIDLPELTDDTFASQNELEISFDNNDIEQTALEECQTNC